MPKSELETYDRDQIKCFIFMRAFENIVRNTSVSSTAKLNRLLQFCKGSDYKVIEHTAVMDLNDGYNKAKQLLEERFGNQHKIAEAWMRKVIQGLIINNSNGGGLRDLVDDLRS